MNRQNRLRPVTAVAMVIWWVIPALGQGSRGPVAVPTETFGEAPAATASSSDVSETQPAESDQSAEASAEDVMQQLMSQRPAAPVIEPNRAPADTTRFGATEPDPRVIGVAPGQPQPSLYREGEFIASRRGRMLRSGGAQWLFQFEADSQASPEEPMLLMPCQLLENMEEIVRQRGDRVVFVLSGQVFTYHGHNWLLPSVMKIDVDRGNLQP